MLCATISKLSLLIALALAGVAAAEPAAPSDAEVLEAFRATFDGRVEALGREAHWSYNKSSSAIGADGGPPSGGRAGL